MCSLLLKIGHRSKVVASFGLGVMEDLGARTNAKDTATKVKEDSQET